MDTPEEHAAEAEHCLKCAASQWKQGNEAAAGVLSQMANARTQLALLASRPTTPDEHAGVGLLDVQAQNIRELTAENERLREDVADIGAERDALAHHAPEVARSLGLGAAVPSTGEDQSGDCVFTGCVLSDGHSGGHAIEDRRGYDLRREPVPEEGSETDER